MSKILTPLLMLALLLSASAQENREVKQRGIQLRGIAFSLFEDIDKLELRAEEKVVGELVLSTDQLRSRAPVSARQFSFGMTQNKVFRPLGSVTLPNEGKDFIIVFVPIKAGYKAFAVRVDDPNFQGDDTYLFNLTKYKLGIRLGTAKQTVAPWKTASLRPTFPKGASYYEALFAYEKDGSYLPFNNTRWQVNPNIKMLLFVFEDSSTGQLSYRSCTELAKR